jgi:hypothetical protein
LRVVFVAAEARWYITMGHGDESVGENGAVERVWSDLTASYPSYFRTRSNTAVTSPAGTQFTRFTRFNQFTTSERAPTVPLPRLQVLNLLAFLNLLALLVSNALKQVLNVFALLNLLALLLSNALKHCRYLACRYSIYLLY